jgi:hypothetical protein
MAVATAQWNVGGRGNPVAGRQTNGLKDGETMKVERVTKMTACLAVILLASPLWAASVRIPSPDQTQTFADGRLTKGSLTWSNKEQALYANITFSNELYDTQGERLTEESFLFKLPGVMADPATKTYYAQDDNGQRVPVATWQDAFFGRRITLSPATCFHIQKDHGRLRVVMTATTAAVVLRNHWIDEGTGMLLNDLFGK